MSKQQKLCKREVERKAIFWEHERELLAGGARFVAGVDEAGRGPLAGPLVVAAVILPPDCWFLGLNDSKKTSAPIRERLYPEILEAAIASSIQIISVEEIDKLNILGATHFGMRAALLELLPIPDVALIDGLPLPACPFQQRNVIKGDSLSASIAAASILAKVTRDRLMVELDAEYPGYGFAQHKGYSTPEHFAALRNMGVCAIHPRSFAPVNDCSQESFEF